MKEKKSFLQAGLLLKPLDEFLFPHHVLLPIRSTRYLHALSLHCARPSREKLLFHTPKATDMFEHQP